MVWLIVSLILLCAVACFTCIVLASIHSRQKPNRYASTAWNWAIGFAVCVVAFPVYTQTRYLSLDEPLVTAARKGRLSDVKNLLAKGADVNAVQDDEGGTPLIAAAAEGHTDVVKYLLSRGADVRKHSDYFGKYAQSPLLVATKYPDIASLLRRAGAQP